MNNFKNRRIKIVAVVLIIAMVILLVASFRLMVVHGEFYRHTSDTKRIKDVYTKAPRGDILDRNGKVLATSRNSFTVQLYADDLKRQDVDSKNEDFKSLVALLEEDGVNYGEENPIEMYKFIYKDIDDYFKEDKLAEDKVIDIILEEDLIKDFLELYSTEYFNFSNASRAINVLEHRSQEELPLIVDMEDSFTIAYREEEIKNQTSLEDQAQLLVDPMDYLSQQIDNIENNEAVLGNILAHPISRKLTYDMLESKGLLGNIAMEDYVFADDIDYFHNKVGLAKDYEGISLDSEAKDDFVFISGDNLEVLLQLVDIDPETGEELVPAQELIDAIEAERNEDLDLAVSIEDGKVDLYYKEGVSTTETPLDQLVRLGQESGILYDFLTREDIKFLAQDANTMAGDTPHISVLDWNYVFVKNKADILKKYNLPEHIGADQALDGIANYYEIESENDFEKLRLVGLNIALDSQGYRSFEPIIITYGLKEETVAKIEEQIFNSGIEVSQHPVRYYPEGTRAAHVLGYMGKISQPNEIQTYVENRGYAPNDLIGKTGVEESFESSLKGREGKKVVQVDSVGNTTDVLAETPPVKGNSLYLTIDMDLQEVAENSLEHALEQLRQGKNFQSKWGEAPLRINESEGRPHYNANSGAVVVLDVNTGEVLALANQKTYDPNLFSTGISEADWKSLFPEDDENPLADRPLLNVAMQTEVSPGSIFKLVPSVAALDLGLSPYTEINCTGYVDIGDARFGCWIYNQYGGAHGYENMYEAIRDSCNYYFYGLAMGGNPDTGEQIGLQLGVDDIRKYAMELGLDEPTGIEINIPYESSGAMPNPDEKRWIIKNQLASVLEEELENYVREDVNLNPDTKAQMISDIVGLIDYPDMEYDELANRLEEIGIDIGVSVGASGENIVDRIKYTYIDQGNWNITDMLNVVIGQGQNAYTPLQMANYSAILCNGGYRNKVSVIKEVTSADGSTSLLKNEPTRERIDLKSYDSLEVIKDGMNMASHFGSIEQVFGAFPVEVGLKTGTAERDGLNPETGQEFDDYSWMIAFAPYEDPQIAICTLLYQAGSGSNGAPIVREIIGEYMDISPEEYEDGEDYLDDQSLESSEDPEDLASQDPEDGI